MVGKGVDNAEVTDIGFGVAGYNVQVNVCFTLYEARKLRTVARVADGGCCHGNNPVCVVQFAHIGKTFHGFNGVGKRLLRKVAVFVNFLAQAQGFFLVVYHVVGTVFINMSYNKAR